jgi:hypothetical protein
MSAPDDRVASALAGWREITEAATPGPWNVETRHGTDITDEAWSEVRIKAPDGSDIASTYISHLLENYRTDEDEAFIVTVRTAFPLLLAAIEAALAKADDWDAEARGIFLEAARTADAGEVGAASALQSAAADLRAAITTALTGTETAP